MSPDPPGDPDPAAAATVVGVEDPHPTHDEKTTGEAPPEVLAIPHEVYARWSTQALTDAPTFYVTADMCTLLDHAAKSLDDTDVMPHHPDYPTGFVVLAEPLRLPYGDGTTQVVHAFGWAAWARSPRLVLTMIDDFVDGAPVGTLTDQVTAEDLRARAGGVGACRLTADATSNLTDRMRYC